ncbi:hypothetical protein [Loktanella sp. S4079]|uniref:hypothetical protein n=1 Tax=Loktanella sp. S4079 TaxID=579483 RepID=UPI0005F9B2B3|nr:hypothetical protein [Loktanella sp. S4079]KJZ18211.1 hypothetical protein TW80_14820 [Loktanella sp. S4079]
MADTATPVEVMLSSLHDIRLPEMGWVEMTADVLVVIGLGIMGAWGLMHILAPFRSPKIQQPDPPGGNDIIVLLHQLRRVAPDRMHALHDRLYLRGQTPTADELRSILRECEARDV